MRKIIYVLFISLAACTESANQPVTEADINSKPTTAPLAAPLVATLSLRDKFDQETSTIIQGENVTFYLTIENTTGSDITLNFSSGQQYDFYIQSTTVEIWRWSRNLAFILSFTSLTVPAQGSIVVNETWNQSLLNGSNLLMGSYTAYGSLLNQSPVAQHEFTVQ